MPRCLVWRPPGKLNLSRLDYIGIALVDPVYYARMNDAIAGQASLAEIVNEIRAQ